MIFGRRLTGVKSLIVGFPIALALLVYLVYLVVYVSYAVALFGFPFDYDQNEVDRIEMNGFEYIIMRPDPAYEPRVSPPGQLRQGHEMNGAGPVGRAELFVIEAMRLSHVR